MSCTWRVLIVDDDQKYRNLLRECFERTGHQVVESSEGEAAIAIAVAEQPQVILLDVELPDAGGSTICRRLKANPLTASLPVAMVTARGDEATRVECFEAGADAYILKPFSFRELLLRIRVLVDSEPSQGVEQFSSGTLVVDFDTHRLRVAGAPAEPKDLETAREARWKTEL